MRKRFLRPAAYLIALLLIACSKPAADKATYFGTLEPFAEKAVYFVLTDRFVDGDPANNYETQGGVNNTFDRPITTPAGLSGNIGYLGGDFRGILDNADYIRAMGFGALWITPIVDNPDEAFTGGNELGVGFFADKGKTGYHGYWGVNFFAQDEHLVSSDLVFSDLARALKQEHEIDIVLDIVANHGSPSFTMPIDQPKFGEIYSASGELIADHQNLEPADLDASNPLHAFFHHERDIAELSNLNDLNPAVLAYFVEAYSYWIEQGAAAFRIDTIKHMPHAFWQAFAEAIRTRHPEFFMFAESWDHNAEAIAQHTWIENGNISVLDFPLQKSMGDVFGRQNAPFESLLSALHLEDQLYQNVYELMSFYDNHDMPRLDATDNGFVNANNFLFTARGIPTIYYGSEIGFRAGRPEHGGNRDYFGAKNIALAKTHPIHAALSNIANVRAASIALQRGLQANVFFRGDQAAFYRVYEHEGVTQTALVLLNKADQANQFVIDQWLSHGEWREANGRQVMVSKSSPTLITQVAANGVQIWLFNAPVTDAQMKKKLLALQQRARR